MAYTTHQRFTKADEHLYFAALKDALAECLRRDAEPCICVGEDGEAQAREYSVHPLRRFIAHWFRRGAPIDPQGFGCPAPSLAITIRQMVLALPSMSAWHADARLWLNHPEVRPKTEAGRERMRRDLSKLTSGPKANQEGWIPWNLMLYAPKDTPYYTFNKKGFEVTTGKAPEFPTEGTT
jgi:hypothetical protein